MSGLNRVMLIGNLGDDPELKGDRSAVLKFNIATTETYLDSDKNRKENTQWHRIAVFGNRGEALAKILKKGMQVGIEGRIENGSYDDKDGVKRYTSEIIATNVVLLGKREDNERGESRGGRERDDRDRGGRDESRSRDDRGGRDDRNNSGRSDDRGGRDEKRDDVRGGGRDDRGGRGNDQPRGSSGGGNSRGNDRDFGRGDSRNDDVPF